MPLLVSDLRPTFSGFVRRGEAGQRKDDAVATACFLRTVLPLGSIPVFGGPWILRFPLQVSCVFVHVLVLFT